MFRSPWQHGTFRTAVAVVRRLLAPWPGVERRFVERLVAGQNARVRRHLEGRPPQSVLLILPRCLKRTGCCADVKADLALCGDCRDCPLGAIGDLCRRHGVRALVAFRSHIAFAMARSERPDVILATACHDRLIKALRSVPEIPALLVPLGDMDRMCINATTDLSWFARELQALRPASPVLTRLDGNGDPAAARGACTECGTGRIAAP